MTGQLNRALKDGDQFETSPGYRWQFVGRTKTAGYCWLLDIAAAKFYLCRTAVATSHATSSAEHQPTEFADDDLQTWKVAVKGGRGVEPETVAYGSVSDIPVEQVRPAPIIDPWLIPTAKREDSAVPASHANKGVPLAERVPPTCKAQAGPPAIWCSRDEGHRPAAAHRFDRAEPPEGYEPKPVDQRPDLMAKWIAEHPGAMFPREWDEAVTPYLQSIKGSSVADTLGTVVRDARAMVAGGEFMPAEAGPVDSEGAPLTGPEPILEPATEGEGAPLDRDYDDAAGEQAAQFDPDIETPLVDPDTEPLPIETPERLAERQADLNRRIAELPPAPEGYVAWVPGQSEHDLIERAAELNAVMTLNKAELDEIKAKLRSMLTPGTHVSTHGQAVVKTPTRTFKLDHGPKLSDAAVARISESKVSAKLAKDVLPPEVYDLFLEDGTSAVELTYSWPTESATEGTDTEGEAFQWLA